MNKKTIKEVCKLAFPAASEMAVYMLVTFFDILMVGKYGGNIAVSTAGLSYEIMYAFSGIFVDAGVSVGITSLVARKVGAKDFKAAEEFASLGFTLGLLVALTISFITFNFCSIILKIAGAKGEVLMLSIKFMKILSFGIFFKMISSSLNSILRGYGDTKTPLIVAIIISFNNILLDFILIFGNFNKPELGVKGAAVAATIAQVLGFIFVSYYIVKKSKIKIRLKYIIFPNFFKLEQLLLLCIPSILEEAAFSISRLISLFIIMHTGNTAFAANQIATTIETISIMPGAGFSTAATTLVGLNIGKNDHKNGRQSAYTCAFIGTSIMVFCSVLFLVCPNFLINLFIKKSEIEVKRLGTLCLMVAAVEQPFIGISLIFDGCLKGRGDTITPFYISLFSSWVIRLPLMFYFIYFRRAPVFYVWWITAFQWTFDALMMFLFFEKSN
jgi:multidrug resistance protein, MATE family